MTLPKVNVKKILYATDLSENAQQAFCYAASLADLYGARIVLLHVLEETPGLDSKLIDRIGEDRWEEIKQRRMADARELLMEGRRAGLGQPEGNDEVAVIRGNPGDIIAETAETSECDIIVMGSRGHGKHDEVMMGSTTRRVLRRTKKPVLIVKTEETAQ